MMIVSADEQRDLYGQRSAGDLAARDRLIESVLPFSRLLAGRFWKRYRHYLDIDDCRSAAAIGAVGGVDHWDPAAGRLTTIVRWWVHKALCELMKTSRVIGVPKHMIWSRGGRRFEEQADAAMRAASNAGLQCVKARDTSDAETLECREYRDILMRCLHALTQRQREVVELRLAGQTYATIAASLGITISGASHVGRDAENKIAAVWRKTIKRNCQ